MASENHEINITEAALKEAKEYIRLLSEWVPIRQEIIANLFSIADAIDAIEGSANIANITGIATAVAGGIGGLIAIVVTGGLAAPLVIGGGIAAVGTITSITSELVGKYLQGNQVKEAQESNDREKEMIGKIESAKAKLDESVKAISEKEGVDEEVVMSTVLMAASSGTNSVSTDLMAPDVMTKMTQLTITQNAVLRTGQIALLLSEVAEISVKGATKIAGAVLAAPLEAVLLVWNIKLLVEKSIEINNGSKSATANALRELAKAFQKQLDQFESLLKELEKGREELEKMLRDDLRQLLAEVSASEQVSESNLIAFSNLINHVTSQAWKDNVFPNIRDLNKFIFNVSRIGTKIEQKIKDSIDDDELINITVIAHGNIDTCVRLPCLYCYMTPSLESITLYEPWGCAIDASVVHGILNNTINVTSVRYTGAVLPAHPSHWNVLPKTMELIPTAIFSPVTIGEQAYRELEALCRANMVRDGIIIPYFTGPGDDLIPFPRVELWELASALSLIGACFERRFAIKIAACLTVQTPHTFACPQYFTVDGAAVPPVTMTIPGTTSATIPTGTLNQIL